MYIFLDIMLLTAHLTDHSINLAFMCTGKPKNIFDLLYCDYSLYCGSLELNLQCFQGMPVKKRMCFPLFSWS